MNKTCKIILAIFFIIFVIVFGILLYKQLDREGKIEELIVAIDNTPCPKTIEEKEETTPTEEDDEYLLELPNSDWDIQIVKTKYLSVSPNTKDWMCHDFMNNYYEEEPIEQFLTAETEESTIVQQTVETEETIETITMVIEEENDKPYFNVSSYNRSALIHLLYFEACSCNDYEDVLEQRAVVSVVFNRLLSDNYEHCYDASDIIFYRYPSGSYAFTPAEDKDRFWNFANEDEKKDFERNYNQLAEKVDYVIEHGCTIPSNVLYFVSNKSYETNSYFKNNHKVYAVYDGTTFMTTEKPGNYE